MVKGKKGQNQATTDEGRGKLTLVLAPALYGFKTFCKSLNLSELCFRHLENKDTVWCWAG